MLPVTNPQDLLWCQGRKCWRSGARSVHHNTGFTEGHHAAETQQDWCWVGRVETVGEAESAMQETDGRVKEWSVWQNVKRNEQTEKEWEEKGRRRHGEWRKWGDKQNRWRNKSEERKKSRIKTLYEHPICRLMRFTLLRETEILSSVSNILIVR